MRGSRRSLAILGILAAVLVAGQVDAGPLDPGRERLFCFTFGAVPAGNNTFALEIAHRGVNSVMMTGILNTNFGLGGSPLTVPVIGSGRFRSDGKLAFSATTGADFLILVVTGILDPPGFDTGDGIAQFMNVASSVSLTFTPAACPTTFNEFPDP